MKRAHGLGLAGNTQLTNPAIGGADLPSAKDDIRPVRKHSDSGEDPEERPLASLGVKGKPLTEHHPQEQSKTAQEQYREDKGIAHETGKRVA